MMLLYSLLLVLCLSPPAWGQGKVPLLDRSHPFAKGLVLFLYGAPGYAGGTRYYDLAWKHHGVLFNFSGRPWVPVPFLPGVKTLIFDGSNDYVEIVRTPILEPAEVTWATWVRSTSASQIQFAAIFTIHDSFNLVINPTGADSTNAWCYINSVDQPTASTGTGALPPHFWFWVACSFKPTAPSAQLRAYVNGHRTGTGTSTLPIPYTAQPLALGRTGSSGTDPFVGMIGPAMMWNRAFSDGEMRDLYRLARHQFRGLILGPRPPSFVQRILGSLFPFFQQ